MERKFGNYQPEERIELLKASAYSVSAEEITRDYTPEELENMKHDFTVESIALEKKEQEKKALTSTLNGEIKILKTNSKTLLSKITKGGEDVKTQLFAFDDQEKGVMNYYDETGDFVYSRKLKPEERQTMIHSLMSGTNG